MNQGTDLSILYSLRKDFTIIAVTGRTGSGCTTIASQLTKAFDETDYSNPEASHFDLNHNSYRKYKIIYKYAKENFRPFTLISYKDVITFYLLRHSFFELIKFIRSETVKQYFERLSPNIRPDFNKEIDELIKLQKDFGMLKSQYAAINFDRIRDKTQGKLLHKLFFSNQFKEFSEKFHSSFKIKAFTKHYLLFQLITDNIRKYENPFIKEKISAKNIFALAKIINNIIKSIRIVDGDKRRTKIVIDSLRNPFEVMFFKQRYSAFYLMSVNRDDDDRESKLNERYLKEYPTLKKFIEAEYSGGKGNEFFKQYVRECIEKSDIHITYRDLEDVNKMNHQTKLLNDNTSPYYSWQMQLLKYVSLIEHPGLVTPSPEERCMQLAYTAKYNSGCISRQVGATITDEWYSVKAIGWNNTPEGQVPCLLRNAEKLLNTEVVSIKEQDSIPDESKRDPELNAFTPYEKHNPAFRKTLEENFKTQIEDNASLLKGRNVCFCFKSLHNSCFEGKNQVHTRSLHAEESAFLQITKYGGTGIKNGKLFTSASPCELCSKKAYQLGIKVIYYIDPYPGISKQQILEAGSQRPELRLFNGAIGNAYHWLYEPLMPYKDELSLVLGHDIEDLTKKQSRDLIKLKKEKEADLKKIQQLELRVKKLKANKKLIGVTK